MKYLDKCPGKNIHNILVTRLRVESDKIKPLRSFSAAF